MNQIMPDNTKAAILDWLPSCGSNLIALMALQLVLYRYGYIPAQDPETVAGFMVKILDKWVKDNEIEITQEVMQSNIDAILDFRASIKQ